MCIEITDFLYALKGATFFSERLHNCTKSFAHYTCEMFCSVPAIPIAQCIQLFV